MAIQTEVWAQDIAGALFPENSFVAKAISDDAFVNNKKVHLPQAGSVPTVERNRATTPATAVNRTDVTAEYELDEYTSTPTKIQDIEEIETSYNKRQSVLREHVEEINKVCANYMLYHWGATVAAAMVRTSGDDRAANVPGATGNRKQITLSDIIKARGIMDDMDIPVAGRCILLPAHMYNDLIENNKQELLSVDFSGQARIQNGNIMSLFGFEIFVRGKNNLLQYTNAATPVLRTPGASALTTANASALCWHPDFVRRAKGAVKVYETIDDPLYYGSIFSAMARLGGRKRYTDGRGVVSIIEAAGA